MFSVFSVMNTYLGGGLLLVGGTTLSIAGLLAVRRKVSAGRLREYHEVAGYLLSVVGTLYAVLLGLVVVDAMSKFQQARYTVAQEANSVANMYALAEGLPAAQRDTIRALCKGYVDEVVDNEWGYMDKCGSSDDAVKYLVRLGKTIVTYEPQTESQKAIYSSLLEEMTQLQDARRARLVATKHGVNSVMWTVLIAGAMFTVVFTYFFALENLTVQIFMTGIVALIINLNLLLVCFFGYPFSGDVKVQPDEFIRNQQIFQHMLHLQAVYQ